MRSPKYKLFAVMNLLTYICIVSPLSVKQVLSHTKDFIPESFNGKIDLLKLQSHSKLILLSSAEQFREKLPLKV